MPTAQHFSCSLIVVQDLILITYRLQQTGWSLQYLNGWIPLCCMKGFDVYYQVYYNFKRKCSLQISVQNYSSFRTWLHLATLSIEFETLVVKLNAQTTQVIMTQTFLRTYTYSVVCPPPNVWRGLLVQSTGSSF